MSKIIYAVFANGDEYDDRFHILKKIWSTKAAAENHIVELYTIVVKLCPNQKD